MTLERELRGSSGDFSSDSLGGSSPGKRTRSEGLPVQRRAVDPAPVTSSTAAEPAVEDPFSLHLLGGGAVVQRHGGGEVGNDTVHAAAARGIESPSGSLPFLDQIQASFGDHDVSGVQAHVGGAASEASAAMGASAFATGNHVAFAGAPDLHTAAHEAAHVVQQKAGVNLYGGVGAVGDSYEQHADAVADRVVAGESAADLLGAGAGAVAGGAVQRKIALPIQMNKAGGDGGAGGAGGGAGGGGGAEGGPGADPVAAAAAGPDAKIAKLHLFVDVDVKELGIKDLTSGRVGHTWISIEYTDVTKVPDTVEASHKALLKSGGKYADPMGFWPDTQNNVYYNPNPFNSWVDGWMRHPDRAHEGSEKAVQTWAITQAEVDAVIAYAESKRGAKYSVYFFNCTTFGAEAVKAAGKSPPANSTAGICFPNAAYDGIKANQAKGKGNTEVQDLDTGNVTTANGPDGKAG